MKRLILHNDETFMDAFNKLKAWFNVDNGGGLEIFALPLNREPYPLDADAIFDLGLTEEETNSIFESELGKINKRRVDNVATGVDFANFALCKIILNGNKVEEG